MLISLFAICYCWWVVTDQLALLARAAGKQTKLIHYGLTLHNQLMSVNRMGGFLLGPILGLIMVNGGSVDELLWAGLVATALAVFALIPFLLFKKMIILSISSGLTATRNKKYSIWIILKNLTIKYTGINSDGCVENRILFMLSLGIYAATSSAIILINVVASMHPKIAPVILQSASLISGTGNLAYNFFLMPKIADLDEQGEKINHYHEMSRAKFVVQVVLTLFFMTVLNLKLL
jgi:hypothetical protein